MSIVKLLTDVLGSKVKKASKIMDVGLDAGTGLLDAAKGGIKHAAIAAIKERATTVAKDFMLQEYNLDFGKGGINAASMTRVINVALQNQGSGLQITSISNMREIRTDITKYAVKLILAEIGGGDNPTDLANRIIKLARDKIEAEIDNMGSMLDNFTPNAYAVRTLELYGEPKVQEPSVLDEKEAESNRERQRRYRASHKGEDK